MNAACAIASTVIGTIAAAFAIWLIVQILNDRRKSRIAYAAAVVVGCLWLPFSWLLLMSGGWSVYRLSWLKMWPILPGLVPGAYFFHPNDALEFPAMGVATLILSSGLIWLGCLGRKRLIAAAGIALLISIPSACIAYALYSA